MLFIPTDPQEMAYKYSVEDRHVHVGDEARNPEASMEKVREALGMLPERERDMLEMYYFSGKGQAEIGRLFNVTQGDVSYRISRSIARLKFFLDLPKVCTRRMAMDLMKILGDAECVSIMILMCQTTSQTAVGNRVGLSQGEVRYRFIKSLERIQEANKARPIYGIYVFIFEKIAANFNILRSLDTQERWADKFLD
ncbi:MAG: sigma-70 family RNA polymerase sigma factor [Dehalococcoidia bacterium]|nr:sigma-70 family RNA polymerase sigma factor [Dehalococcoidia bacterium]